MDSLDVVRVSLSVGDTVMFVDSQRNACHALVTQVWPDMSGHGVPGCNLVIVSRDGACDDKYGRQIERHSSVAHKKGNPAPGNYWMWPDEGPALEGEE